MRSDEHGGVRHCVNPQSDKRDVIWMCLSFLGTKRGTPPLHELEIEATKNPTVFRGYKRLPKKHGGLEVCWCQHRRMHDKEHDPKFRSWGPKVHSWGPQFRSWDPKFRTWDKSLLLGPHILLLGNKGPETVRAGTGTPIQPK